MLYVTNHAVRRYAERVLKVNANGPFQSAMRYVEDATGLTVDEIRSMIIDDVEPRVPHMVLFKRSRRVIRGIHAKYVVNDCAVHTCYIGDETDR